MIMTYQELTLTLARFARLELPRGVIARVSGEISGFNVTDAKVTIEGRDGAGTHKTITLGLVQVPTDADMYRLSNTLHEVYF